MDKTKAVFTCVAFSAGLIWAGTNPAIPLPNVLQDISIGIVGVLGLTIGAVVKGLGAAMMPLAMVLRVIAFPLMLGVIGWLGVKELRRVRS